jgi:4-methylaminobutanoate oxidase (formaldehyde-forming)
VLSAAGVGRLLSGWMLDGRPEWDAWEVDIARADPAAATGAHMAARMHEAVSDLFALHWPGKQAKAGRGLRCSVLHDHWAREGAQFGVTAGWERGLWYARDAAERDLPYSVGDQAWWPIAAGEAGQMAGGTALLELSPFTKIDVSGPDALAFLNANAAAQMDVAVGRAVYTPVLNDAGGIEMDVTITRTGETAFRVTSGAATRWRDMALLRRRAVGHAVTLTDRTEDEAVIGVMGAGARDLLAGLSAGDWAAFPFATRRAAEIAGVPCHATRISFVGEMGWELSIPVDGAGAVFDALVGAGARPMGHYALDGCRIEKGFKHWGNDLGPEITPLEAGLGFTIDWSKGFTGKAALERQKAQGITRRLCLFAVEGGPLLLHDEPVFEAGRHVGLTTSGGRGPRSGLDLALAMISTAPGETLSDSCARRFSLRVAGRDYPARALRRAPYDPDGTRMKR